MTHIWLAKQSGTGPSDVLGIFSRPERAKKACQGIADEYFGAQNTNPLQWLGNDGYCSASHHDPGSGMILFQVTRFAVDQAVTP